MSDYIGVMYLGNLVEYGPAEDIIRTPYHPYMRALLSAVPIPDPKISRGRTEIKGDLPSPINLPTGCPFHPRCLYAKAICKEKKSDMKEVKTGHFAQCHFAGELSFGVPAIQTFEETVKNAGKVESQR
jgi:peptide/nickel transport system ATP-binding protein